MSNQRKITLTIITLLSFSINIVYAAPTSLQQCAAITDSNKRLKCFDQLSHPSASTQAVTPSPANPVLQTVQADLQEAWDKNIQSVVIDSTNALVVHTGFKTVNQTTYEVMLSVVCGGLFKEKDQKTLQRLAAIAIVNKPQQQGYVFVNPLQCISIAFKPLDQIRLVILGSTQELSK